MKNEITYVFIGQKIPNYGRAALELSIDHSGSDIVFLGNKSLQKEVKKLRLKFVPIEDFYDGSEFHELHKKFEFSNEFRNGFWSKAFERFFILEQYMKVFNIDKFFHAELDQILFRSDLLIEKLSCLETNGFFVPFHNKDLAVASVCFCNNRNSLRNFLNFTNSQEKIMNEMLLLASWGKAFPEDLHVLPSLGTIQNKENFAKSLPNKIIDHRFLGGVVDAAQLGQWVGGEDPRNLRLLQTPKTRFFQGPDGFVLDLESLESLQFGLDSKSAHFFVITNNSEEKYNLFNLHFHSKLHGWLLKTNDPIKRLLVLANETSSTSIFDARISQISYRLTYFFSETMLAIKKNPKKLLSIPLKLLSGFFYLTHTLFIALLKIFKKKK